MPKFIDPADELKRLRSADPNTLHQYTTRLTTALAEKVVESARTSGNQVSREVATLLSFVFTCRSHGVAFTFDADTRQKLDLCCGAMGIDREALVRLIVGENLSTYLRRGLDLQAERDAVAAEVAAATEAKAKAKKPK